MQNIWVTFCRENCEHLRLKALRKFGSVITKTSWHGGGRINVYSVANLDQRGVSSVQEAACFRMKERKIQRRLFGIPVYCKECIARCIASI